MMNNYPPSAVSFSPAPPPPLPPRPASSSLPSSSRSLHGSLLDCHNLSQDSGVISPSPQISSSTNFGGSQTGIYDNYVAGPQHQQLSSSVGPTPSPRLRRRRSNDSDSVLSRQTVTVDTTKPAARSSSSSRWRLGSFFKRRKDQQKRDEHFRELVVKDAVAEPPPQLPPRSGSSSLDPQARNNSSFQTPPPRPPTSNLSQNNGSNYYYDPTFGHVRNDPPLPHYESPADALSRVDPNRLSMGSAYSEPTRGSWREQREYVKQRVEAKRNSFRDSSSEDEDGQWLGNSRDWFEDDTTSSQSSRGRNSMSRRGKSSSSRHNKLLPLPPQSPPGVAVQPEDDDHWRQAQMAVVNRFSQIELQQQQQHLTATPPPPPPPRDPRKKLYLLKNEDGRPVSYSFEPVHSPSPHREEPDDLGVPIVPRQQQPITDPGQSSPSPHWLLARRPLLDHRQHHLSRSDQHLSAWNQPAPSQPIRYTPQHGMHLDNRQQHQPLHHPPTDPNIVDETPRSRRPINLQRSLPVGSPPAVTNPMPLKQQSRYSSQPSLLVQHNLLAPAPPAEYWKSPPPFPPHSFHHLSDRPAHLVLSDQSREASPMRPLRKKLSNSSAASAASGNSSVGANVRNSAPPVYRERDSAHATSCSSIEKSGKSSPSSSISSKDSGCSDSVNGSLFSKGTPRPLSAVMENSLETPALAPPAVKEMSPPRSNADDPGFSTKKRRSRFEDALSELEEVFSGIQKDQDLLDRAERRDLPTAHQELIAQAREKFQPGASEENSRHDDSEAVFSDMDNFMNWNTSSSFENLPSFSSPAPGSAPRRRSRTPANRRSGVIDKKGDDMAYRKAQANNKLQSPAVSALARTDQSYLRLSPHLNSANDIKNEECKKNGLLDEDEPDTRTDDVVFRTSRDANANNIVDPQPKFGIPKEAVPACSNKDYLHAVPEGKYKSTFHAMRHPDTVKDDLAFRNLRRDDNLSDPNHLGIVKDPGMENVEPLHCWHHKMLERERGDDPASVNAPFVFYPNKHNNVMMSLSKHIAEIIRKQSGNPEGGDDGKIVTYEEMRRKPDVYEAMKYTLNIIENEDKDADEDKRQWSGKNVFQLLGENVAELLEKKKGKKSKQSADEQDSEHDGFQGQEKDGADDRGEIAAAPNEVVVQHCILEHDLDEFNKTLSKQLRMSLSGGCDIQSGAEKEQREEKIQCEDEGKEEIEEEAVNDVRQERLEEKLGKGAGSISMLSRTVENMREAEQKLERSCSGSETEKGATAAAKKISKSTLTNDALPSERATAAPISPPVPAEDDPPLDVLPFPSSSSSASASSASLGACSLQKMAAVENEEGETSLDQRILTWLDHPLFLLTCYILICANQLLGLDFLTALGLLFTVLSMISVCFL